MNRKFSIFPQEECLYLNLHFDRDLLHHLFRCLVSHPWIVNKEAEQDKVPSYNPMNATKDVAMWEEVQDVSLAYNLMT